MASLYELLNEGKILRTVTGECVQFLIQSKDIVISEQGIHTLKNERHPGLLECFTGTRNGEIYLRYYVTGLEPLSAVVIKADPQSFVQYLINLKSVLEIENFDINDGFLNKNNIAIDFSDVYVDTNTGKVYLLYVPLVLLNNENCRCELILGSEIQQAVKFNVNLLDKITERLCDRLSSGVPVMEALSEISSKHSITHADYVNEIDMGVPPIMQTIDVGSSNLFDNAQTHGRRSIFKRETSVKITNGATEILEDIHYYFVSEKLNLEFELPVGTTSIGQNNGTDIDLGFLENKAISRYHAEIVVSECGGIVIKDVGTKQKGSKNGTFIIQSGIMGISKPSRLAPNKEYKIGQGSKIRIANVDFIIMKK